MNNKFILEIINSKNSIINQLLLKYIERLIESENNFIYKKNNINKIINNKQQINYSKSILNDLLININKINYPFGFIKNKKNFIYFLLLPLEDKNNPLNTFYKLELNYYEIQVTKNKILTFNVDYDDNDDKIENYFVFAFLFFNIKKYINKIFNFNEITIVNDIENLPNEINSLDDLNPFITLFSFDYLIAAYCLNNLIKLFEYEDNNMVNGVISILDKNINTIIDCHINCLNKILYSCFGSLEFVDLSELFNDYCFTYETVNKKINLVYSEIIPNITIANNLLEIPQEMSFYSSIKFIPSYFIKYIGESKIIEIENKTWYDFFDFIDKDNIEIMNISLRFKKDIFLYIYPYRGFFDLLFELFFIRGDNIAWFNTTTVCIIFKKDQILYAKPSSFIPLEILPGNIDNNISIFNKEEYINNYNLIYKENYNFLHYYFENGKISFTKNIINELLEIKSFIILNKKDCYKIIINDLKLKVNNDLLKFYQLLFLINNKVKNKNLFKKSLYPNIISPYELNKIIFIIIFSKNVYTQNISESISNYLNNNWLIENMKPICNNNYKNLKNKSNFYKLYPGSECLYSINNYSSTCFDQICKSNNDSDLLIKQDNKEKCNYNICTNGISLDQLITGNNISFNNLLFNTNCANFNIDFLTNGAYNILFIDNDNNKKFIWYVNINNFVITLEQKENLTFYNKNNFKFELVKINNKNKNMIQIKDICFKNNILIYEKNKYTNFLITLYDNQYQLIDEKNETPIIKNNNDIFIKNIIPLEINDVLLKINFNKI